MPRSNITTPWSIPLTWGNSCYNSPMLSTRDNTPSPNFPNISPSADRDTALPLKQAESNGHVTPKSRPPSKTRSPATLDRQPTALVPGTNPQCVAHKWRSIEEPRRIKPRTPLRGKPAAPHNVTTLRTVSKTNGKAHPKHIQHQTSLLLNIAKPPTYLGVTGNKLIPHNIPHGNSTRKPQLTIRTDAPTTTEPNPVTHQQNQNITSHTHTETNS